MVHWGFRFFRGRHAPEVSSELLYNNVYAPGQHDGFVTQWNENLFGKGIRKNIVNDSPDNNVFYPNPTSGMVSLNTNVDSEISEVEISNSRGQIMEADVQFENGVIRINLGKQAMGIYFIKYTIDGKTHVERISLMD